MKKDVLKLCKKSILFSLPIFIWFLIVIFIDPFNYFNFSNIISKEVKEQSSKKVNSLLYNSIDFMNYPNENIIIGDSRIRRLSNERIEEITKNKYYTLHSNAAKLNEIIDLFWLADKEIELKNVMIGINFNLYNKYAYSDRVNDVKYLIKNPLIYVFNKKLERYVII